MDGGCVGANDGEILGAIDGGIDGGCVGAILGDNDGACVLRYNQIYSFNLGFYNKYFRIYC